jgi:hypothetical protein
MKNTHHFLMVYSDFTMTQLIEKFGLIEKKESIIPLSQIPTILPSQRLRDDLAEARLLPEYSEKAKSEHIIAPILREVWRQNKYAFELYSGYSFNVSEADKLTGVCDYLFSTEKSIEIRSAVFCIVEAKNRTVEEGIAQAFAEMYAAQLFNSKHKKETPIVYGCVTTAYEWLFLRLSDKQASIDLDRYHINETNLPTLLGILNYIVGIYLIKEA